MLTSLDFNYGQLGVFVDDRGQFRPFVKDVIGVEMLLHIPASPVVFRLRYVHSRRAISASV